MRRLGHVLRLQVQTASLKLPAQTRKKYDPSPLRSVDHIGLAPEGVTWDGGHDVHHARHPAGKNNGSNGISIGFTSHYTAMRARFGCQLADGVAGENILIGCDLSLSVDDLAAGLLIESVGGPIHLARIVVAEPCVEYTRFALRYPLDRPSDQTVTEALRFLRAGTRGFYASFTGSPTRVAVGAEVFIP